MPDDVRAMPVSDPSDELLREIGLVTAAMEISMDDLERLDPDDVTRRFGRVIALLVDEPDIELGRPDESEPLSAAEVELVNAYRAGQLPIFEREIIQGLRAAGP